ncbi:YqjF family protein [Peribacillus sp. NPDC046944]|uniref:YqjF family protein n=2 Tax=Peribacillus TaxID=2675229 RepID=UPI003CFC98FC
MKDQPKHFNENKWDDSHRSWPLPRLPWTMKQTWNDLLFAHYPIKIEALQKLVPAVLPLDSFDGMGWIGVVPFHMTDIRLRGLPPVPGTDRFPELNVRTYVTVDGKPGVYFFSLDASNMLAVKTAQTVYHLPYKFADMNVQRSGDVIDYISKRRNGNQTFECTYKPTSEPYLAEKGSFDEWLTERYCLYTLNNKGVPLRCDILHKPWPLQHAEADIRQNTMLTNQGIHVENDKPILHFAKTLEVRMWPLVRATD